MQMAWQQLSDASFLSRKGDRVATCRWFHWQNRMLDLSRDWHSRLLVLLHVCLELGISTKSVDLMKVHQASEVPSNQEPQSTAEQKKELQSMRDKATNTLGLLLAIHSQPSV